MIKFFEKHNLFSWTITLIGGILIFYISTIDFGNIQTTKINLVSIVYHFYAFFLFSAFLMISVSQGKRIKIIPITLILSILYGILDEIHQYFIPYRAFDPLDMLTDTAGILFAGFLYYGILKNRK